MVVCRPRPSCARTGPVSWASWPRSALTSVDFPTPDEPTIAASEPGGRCPRNASSPAPSRAATATTGAPTARRAASSSARPGRRPGRQQVGLREHDDGLRAAVPREARGTARGVAGSSRRRGRWRADTTSTLAATGCATTARPAALRASTLVRGSTATTVPRPSSGRAATATRSPTTGRSTAEAASKRSRPVGSASSSPSAVTTRQRPPTAATTRAGTRSGRPSAASASARRGERPQSGRRGRGRRSFKVGILRGDEGMRPARPRRDGTRADAARRRGRGLRPGAVGWTPAIRRRSPVRGALTTRRGTRDPDGGREARPRSDSRVRARRASARSRRRGPDEPRRRGCASGGPPGGRVDDEEHSLPRPTDRRGPRRARRASPRRPSAGFTVGGSGPRGGIPSSPRGLHAPCVPPPPPHAGSGEATASTSGFATKSLHPTGRLAVTGGRTVSLPWDAPEVSETVFGSRARVEFHVASSGPSTTHAPVPCGRARPRRGQPGFPTSRRGRGPRPVRRAYPTPSRRVMAVAAAFHLLGGCSDPRSSVKPPRPAAVHRPRRPTWLDRLPRRARRSWEIQAQGVPRDSGGDADVVVRLPRGGRPRSSSRRSTSPSSSLASAGSPAAEAAAVEAAAGPCPRPPPLAYAAAPHHLGDRGRARRRCRPSVTGGVPDAFTRRARPARGPRPRPDDGRDLAARRRRRRRRPSTPSRRRTPDGQRADDARPRGRPRARREPRGEGLTFTDDDIRYFLGRTHFGAKAVRLRRRQGRRACPPTWTRWSTFARPTGPRAGGRRPARQHDRPARPGGRLPEPGAGRRATGCA